MADSNQYNISGYRVIYSYTIDDEAHRGLVKIAERILHLDADEAELAREDSSLLDEQIKRHLPPGANLQKIWLGLYSSLIGNVAINAQQVYDIIDEKGVAHKFMLPEDKDKWFAVSVDDIDLAVNEAGRQSYQKEQSRRDREAKDLADTGRKKKKSQTVTSSKRPTRAIRFRPEQERAIEDTVDHFQLYTTHGSETVKPRFLWNAKMRFGKTLSALEVAKRRGYKSILIITHRPVVDYGWHEDFEKIFFDKPNFKYGSRNINDDDNIGNFEDLTNQTNVEDGGFVFFVSMQYLRLSKLVGGKEKNKNAEKEAILNYPWEFVVIDEAHEGTKSDQGSNVMKYLWLDTPDVANETPEEAKKAKRSARKTLPHTLSLSGTPFNLYGDFGTSEIYTWDYVAEQEAKLKWNEKNGDDPNPYDVLPRMHIFNHDILGITGPLDEYGDAKEVGEFDDDELDETKSGFSFSEFFRVWEGKPKKDKAQMPSEAHKGRFIHEQQVKKFFHHLAVGTEEGSNYPFSTDEFRMSFRHTFWMVPGVPEAKTLKNILEEEYWEVDGEVVDNPYFANFKIINVAGSGDEEQDTKALRAVKKGIREAEQEGKYTITLSCGKLTTGVSIPEWTAVFYLKGNDDTRASAYLQTIFRVQTPAVFEGRQKTDAYVFDFSPTRSLRVFAEAIKLNVATKTGRDPLDPSDPEKEEEEADKWLRYMPIRPLVPGVDGTMRHYDAKRLFDELNRHLTERAVRSGYADNSIYDPVAIMALDEEGRKTLADLGALIDSNSRQENTGHVVTNPERPSKGTRVRVDPNDPDSVKKEKTEDQKKLEEWNREKRNRMKILRAMSVRIPLLMYGAEVDDENTELDINNFTTLFKGDRQSWDEFMPEGVTPEIFDKLRACYNPSVFRSAAKQIREYARHADRMDVEERIAKIAEVFSFFHNPDKETVLTPWRVVNMHMSDTIGGYAFFDDTFIDKPSHRLTEPREVRQEGVTERVLDAETLSDLEGIRILELNSKTGLYPLYVTYALYRARKHFYQEANALDSKKTVPEDRHIWDETLRENIFVVCKTEMARLITRRTLVGFRRGADEAPLPVNAIYPTWQLTEKELVDGKVIKMPAGEKPSKEKLIFTDLVGVLRAKPTQFEEDVQSRKWWEKQLNYKLDKQTTDMIKFNAVVGNPPYQETKAKKETENGQKSVTNIFHFFQLAGDNIANVSSLIYPGGRWIHQSGKGLAEFGKSQINDIHLQRLIFYPDASEIFDNVSIADGISIVLKNSEKTSDNFEYVYSLHGNKTHMLLSYPGDALMPLNPFYGEILEVINQVVSSNNWKSLSEGILPRSLFGIESDFVERNPNLVREYNEGELYNPTSEVKVFTNDKAGKSGRARWYITNKSNISTGIEYLDKWKVVVSSANAGGQKRSNQIAILDDKSAFGRSRVALKTFATKKEAENFFKYATSELIRFTFLLTDESLTSLAKQVPDILDYTDNNGVIDFNGNVNVQLYEIFGIDSETQNQIRELLSQYPQ